MKILITGGLGFIGSNFVRYISKNRPEWHVCILDKETKTANIKNVEDLFSEKIKFVKGDILDFALLDKLVSDNDIVLHLAAEVSNDKSIQNPRLFIETNILGTFNILEAVRKHNKRLHYVSTDEVFGDLPLNTKEKFNENSKYNPSSPYSASKASGDHLVKAWIKTFKIQATISNCTNNYGPYASTEKMIPFQIINILKNKKCSLFGNGENIRDWIHVEDHCSAIIKILEIGKIGDTYLISANCELKNIEVLRFILNKMNKNENDFIFVSDRPGHDLRYALDSTKIRKELNWKPRYESFEEGLNQTIQWYISNAYFWENKT